MTLRNNDRKYDEDCEKLTDKVAEVYALVKKHFKTDFSVILGANKAGRLDILWEVFLEITTIQ
jgi:hypothetical protein